MPDITCPFLFSETWECFYLCVIVHNLTQKISAISDKSHAKSFVVPLYQPLLTPMGYLFICTEDTVFVGEAECHGINGFVYTCSISTSR